MFSLVVLVLSFQAAGQANKLKVYKCYFKDTVTVNIPDSAVRDLALQAAEEQDLQLPDSLLQDLTQSLSRA